MKKIIKQIVNYSNNKKRYGGNDYMSRMKYILSKKNKKSFKKLSLNNLKD